MRTLGRCFLVFVFAFPLIAGAQPSQNPNPETRRAQPQVSVPPAPAQAVAQGPGPIQLDVVVTDKAGKPVAGLRPSDFALFNDGHPQAINSFQAFAGDRSPAQIVMAIDMVNEGFMKVAQERGQIDEFLRADGGRLAHPLSLVLVTDTGLEPLGPGSADGNVLAAQLDKADSRLRTEDRRSQGAWGAVDMFDMSLKMLGQLVQEMAPFRGRKLLIWIGPGWPMLDSPYLQMTANQQQGMFRTVVDLRSEMRKGEISLYSVTDGMPDAFTFAYTAFLKGVRKPSSAYPANLELKVLAVQSGGLVEPPSNGLKQAIEKCAQDGDAYYRIAFDPPPAHEKDEYHDLKVKIVDQPGLTARTDTGYYDQP